MNGTRLCALLLLCAAPAWAAAVYHVSPGGNDAADGSAGAPFRTLQRCAQQAQAGDTCRAHAGTYRETVTPPRSGTAAAHLRFEAAPGECVTVNGADILAPAWAPQPGSGTLFVASTPLQFTQLFAGGALLNEARWPDADPADLVHQPFARAGAGTDSSGVVVTAAPAATTWVGAYALVMPGAGRASRTRRITAWDPAAKKATFDRAMSGPEGPPAEGTRYFLFGALALLDHEGEWFLDTAAQKLYLWAPGGQSPAGTALQVKQRNWAFDVSNQSYIEIAGFNLFAAAIRLNNANNCTVDGVHGQYTSAMRETDAWDLAPLQNSIVGNSNTWKNSVVAGSAAAGLSVQGSDNLVQDNVIHDVDTAAIQRAGIELATSGTNARNLIGWNTVYRAGWAGLGLTGGAGTRALYNQVTDADLLAWDSGAIYAFGTDGQGAEIAYNELANLPDSTPYATGVYLDDGSKNFVVHHNWVHDVGWYGITFKHQNAIFNNTVLNAGVSPFNLGQNAQTHAWDAIAAAMVFNNLIDAGAPVAVALLPSTVTDGGDFSAWVTGGPGWKRFTVPFASMVQPSWAKAAAFDLTKVQALQLRGGALGDFDLEVDNVRLEGPAPRPVSDFEASLASSFGTPWTGSSANGSAATLVRGAPGASCSLGAAELTGTRRALGSDALGLGLAAPGGTADLSAYAAVSFDLRARARSWIASLYQIGPAQGTPQQGLNFACGVDATQRPIDGCAQGRSLAIAPYTAAGADLGAFQSGAARWSAGAGFADTLACGQAASDLVVAAPVSGGYPVTPPGTFTAQPFADWPDTCGATDGGVGDAGGPDAGADAGTDAGAGDGGGDAGQDGGALADAGGSDGGPTIVRLPDNGATGPGSGPQQSFDLSGRGCSTAGSAWLAVLALGALGTRRRR